MITKESLQAQLDSSERELENAKAVVYRVDGIIQLLKHLLADFDEPEQVESKPVEPPVSGPKLVDAKVG